jgi:Sec-independent protein translocase protein TatA
MSNALIHFAYLGPGGPEFLLIMLVLLVMFGAKDAPRILRKLNDMINQVRTTADSFKREVMYGDLNSQNNANAAPPENTDDDYGDEYFDEDYQDMDDEEVFEKMPEELRTKTADIEPKPTEPEPVLEQPEEEDGDDRKD